MNIAVDYGNTAAKVGIFDHGNLTNKQQFKDPEELKSFLTSESHDNIIVSSVSHSVDEILSWSRADGKKVKLHYQLALPVTLNYATPQTLGVDRIAAACGAAAIFPAQDCLVVDAGTCLTYEFVDRNANYFGGGISPGVAMRFEAMHQFTAKLPLITAVVAPSLIGDTTESAMQSGVVNGIRAEVEGIWERYLELYPQLRAVVCGGDSVFFENRMKRPIFASPDLVLIGLNSILQRQLHG